MKPEEQKKLAQHIFNIIYPFNRCADRLITLEFKSRRFLGSSDRREISFMIWNAIRNFAKIKYSLEKKNKELTADNIFNESLLQYDRIHIPDFAKSECPEWLWEDLKHRSKDLLFMQTEAFPVLRINISKTNQADVIKLLKDEEIYSAKCTLSSIGISLLKRCNLQATKALKKGLIEVQDEGSQLVSLLAAFGLKTGDKVIDLCAGGGGKSLAIYDKLLSLGEKIDLTSCDIAKSRLANLSKRAKLAGFKDIKTHLLTDDYEPYLSKNAGTFDLVLVDAPCSGTGTWRRAPDAKWRTFLEDVLKYEALQTSILSKAGKFVKKGGRLVYITCSLRATENEEQIKIFLKNNPDFEISRELLPRWKMITGVDFEGDVVDEGLYLSPAKLNTDGFFISELIRK